MEIKELRKLAKACRKLGISRLKTDEIELDLSESFTPASRKTRTHSPANDAVFEDAPTRSELSDHDLLFWSSQPSATRSDL